MALSEHEKQVLQQMEDQLREGDPDLARQLGRSAPAKRQQRRLGARMVAAMFVLFVIGLVLLVVGVSLPWTLPGVACSLVGFLVMVAGVTLPFHAGARRRLAARKRSRGSDDFMERQRQRWDSR